MAHTYNPSTEGGRGRRIAYAQEFETSLGNVARLGLYKNFEKLARWCMPVVTATQEAEVEGSLETGSLRLQ